MAKAAEALIQNDEKLVLEALKDDNAMVALADKAKEITRVLVQGGTFIGGDFDVSVKEDRAEIKRIGRRIGRTAKDINDCGVNYLRDIKSKIKLVEKRKKWFIDELAIVRASVEKPVIEWESARVAVDNAISRFQRMTLDSAETEDVATLERMLTDLGTEPDEVVEDRQEEYSAALVKALAVVNARIKTVKELHELRAQQEANERAELERLRKENEALKKAAVAPPEPVPLPAPEPPTPSAPEPHPLDNALYVEQLECLCVDLYNEFAQGDAHFTGEMKRLGLLNTEEEPF